MALENLQAATRIEAILNGDDITPATRREYFLKRAANEVPAIASGDAGKVLTVNAGETGVEWAEAGGGGGVTASCTFAVYYDETVGDVVIECDKTYTELAAILQAAEAPVYSEVNYMGIRLYSVVYPTNSLTGDQYIGSPIHLLMAREHQTQGRVVDTFDAFVGRLSDNTLIVLHTPT